MGFCFYGHACCLSPAIPLRRRLYTEIHTVGTLDLYKHGGLGRLDCGPRFATLLHYPGSHNALFYCARYFRSLQLEVQPVKELLCGPQCEWLRLW
jgi:hypothetical protein